MDRIEIVARLTTFVEQEFPNPGLTLTDSTDLLEEWFVDSLGIIETVLFVETHFDLKLSRADINGTNFQSIATLSDFIATKFDSR